MSRIRSKVGASTFMELTAAGHPCFLLKSENFFRRKAGFA